MFRSVLDDISAAGLELARDQSLTAMPRGYAEHADAWCADYLKLQALYVTRELTPSQWTEGVADIVADHALACASLIEFGRGLIKPKVNPHTQRHGARAR